MKKLLLPVLILLPLACFASIEWKKKVIDYDAAPGQESVTADFYFANTGQSPIHILSTKTSCGCTVAHLDKEYYLPGEIGTLKTTFTFGGRTGPQEKGVEVYTDDPLQPTVLLKLNVNIPLFLAIDPQLLFWTGGEKPAAKSAVITVLSQDPVFIEKVDCDNPAFTYDLTRLEDGRNYRLTVTPPATDKPAQGTITFTTNLLKDAKNPATAKVMLQVY